MSNLTISVATLRGFARNLLIAMSCPRDRADIIADSLIKSDIRGISTHGLALLPMYAKMVSDAAIDPLANITITHKTDCIISVDGHDAFGQLVGRQATEAGIEAARKTGMAMVAVHRASHLGRLGEWAEMAADAGLVFSAFSNTSGGAVNVAAFGGHQRKLSTNPIAFAVPTFDALPFNIIVDFATSQVSGAVIQRHSRTNVPLHSDWTSSETGEAITDARAFMAGEGALLPLGGRLTGHKGYGLALVAELFGGMAGGLVVGQHQSDWFSNAALFSFLDPLQLLTIEDIRSRINSLVAHLDEDGVRLPGQRSHENTLLTEKQGVSIEPHVLQSLLRTAAKLGVDVGNEFN